MLKQLAAQERLVAALKGYSRLAQALYDGGRVPYTAVLQAEEQLLPAELNLVAARARLFASAVNIYKAMGGGWVDEAAKLTSAPEPVAMPNGDKVDDK